MKSKVRYIGIRSSGIFIGLLLLMIFTSSCSVIRSLSFVRYTYQIPEMTGDGWDTATLEEVGMDTRRMETFMNDLAKYPDHWVHGVVVVKDGKMVFEEYFPGRDLDLSILGDGLDYAERDFDRDTLHCLASDSKSVTSILVGVAMDEGLIQGVDEALFSYFPDYTHLSDTTKSQITLEHMLTMSSGLPWTEAYSYNDSRNDLTAMVWSDDPIAYVLSKSPVAAPDRRFIYNSGTTNLLGEIVHRASGMTLKDYAERKLFTPLDIDSFEWYPFPSAPQMTVASSTLYLRPRDMAKIGQLYLDGGVWKGKRVVSEDWVSQSTQEAVDLSPSESPIPGIDPNYGYQWWLGTFPAGNTDTFFAAGFGGQFIFALPEPEMVVVITAGGFEEGNYDPLLKIVNDYVLPAAGK